MERYLERLSEPPPPLSPPALTATGAGQFERNWRVQFSTTVPVVDDELADEVRARSVALLGTTASGVGAADLVDIALRRLRPRTLEVRIVRRTNEMLSAVDTAVLSALEQTIGRVTELEERPRSRWGDWPLPRAARTG